MDHATAPTSGDHSFALLEKQHWVAAPTGHVGFIAERSPAIVSEMRGGLKSQRNSGRGFLAPYIPGQRLRPLPLFAEELDQKLGDSDLLFVLEPMSSVGESE
jgi:hypothetical protein